MDWDQTKMIKDLLNNYVYDSHNWVVIRDYKGDFNTEFVPRD